MNPQPPAETTKGRWGSFLPRALTAATIIAVPCLSLLAFGPGLVQGLRASSGNAGSSPLGRPVSAADLTAPTKGVAATRSEAMFLANWEYTKNEDHNLRELFKDVAKADSLAAKALQELNDANTASKMQFALHELRDAARFDEQASRKLLEAGKDAVKLNPSLAGPLFQDVGRLVSDSVQIALQVDAALALFKKTNNLAGLQAYIAANITPLIQDAAAATKQAQNDISQYK